MTAGSSGPVRLVVCDLDGVIRYFDEVSQEISRSDMEQELGLAPGFVLQVAFEEKLLRRAVTGTITDDQWRASVVTELARAGGQGRAERAVQAWSSSPGRIDARVLALVGRFEHASRSCC